MRFENAFISISSHRLPIRKSSAEAVGIRGQLLKGFGESNTTYAEQGQRSVVILGRGIEVPVGRDQIRVGQICSELGLPVEVIP